MRSRSKGLGLEPTAYHACARVEHQVKSSCHDVSAFQAMIVTEDHNEAGEVTDGREVRAGVSVT